MNYSAISVAVAGLVSLSVSRGPTPREAGFTHVHNVDRTSVARVQLLATLNLLFL